MQVVDRSRSRTSRGGKQTPATTMPLRVEERLEALRSAPPRRCRGRIRPRSRRRPLRSRPERIDGHGRAVARATISGFTSTLATSGRFDGRGRPRPTSSVRQGVEIDGGLAAEGLRDEEACGPRAARPCARASFGIERCGGEGHVARGPRSGSHPGRAPRRAPNWAIAHQPDRSARVLPLHHLGHEQVARGRPRGGPWRGAPRRPRETEAAHRSSPSRTRSRSLLWAMASPFELQHHGEADLTGGGCRARRRPRPRGAPPPAARPNSRQQGLGVVLGEGLGRGVTGSDMEEAFGWVLRGAHVGHDVAPPAGSAYPRTAPRHCHGSARSATTSRREGRALARSERNEAGFLESGARGPVSAIYVVAAHRVGHLLRPGLLGQRPARRTP